MTGVKPLEDAYTASMIFATLDEAMVQDSI